MVTLLLVIFEFMCGSRKFCQRSGCPTLTTSFQAGGGGGGGGGGGEDSNTTNSGPLSARQ